MPSGKHREPSTHGVASPATAAPQPQAGVHGWTVLCGLLSTVGQRVPEPSPAWASIF